MSDLPEPGEDAVPEPPRKTHQWAWALVILFFVWLIVDILAITALGTNANHTFSTISTKK